MLFTFMHWREQERVGDSVTLSFGHGFLRADSHWLQAIQARVWEKWEEWNDEFRS
jgi:hypothetical protein